jgi:hypothetical protein
MFDPKALRILTAALMAFSMPWHCCCLGGAAMAGVPSTVHATSALDVTDVSAGRSKVVSAGHAGDPGTVGCANGCGSPEPSQEPSRHDCGCHGGQYVAGAAGAEIFLTSPYGTSSLLPPLLPAARCLTTAAPVSPWDVDEVARRRDRCSDTLRALHCLLLI